MSDLFPDVGVGTGGSSPGMHANGGCGLRVFTTGGTEGVSDLLPDVGVGTGGPSTGMPANGGCDLGESPVNPSAGVGFFTAGNTFLETVFTPGFGVDTINPGLRRTGLFESKTGDS